MGNRIEFFCYEKDEPIEVQLEPEGITFITSPGNILKFVAINSEADFRWVLRVELQNKSVQLFPESSGTYEIEIYENDKLVYDRYKHRR